MADEMNVVVLRGVVERPPEVRELADGTELATLDVRTEVATGRVTAPVAWPPNGQALPQAGTEVVVTGHVRRRFFRAGGGTQSRTEVVADAVVPVRSKARARRAIDEAVARVLEPAAS
jgi:single-strand DNA-binding protein